MLKFFSDAGTAKPSHNRSKTLPYVQQLDFDGQPASTVVVKGFQFDLLDPKSTVLDPSVRTDDFVGDPITEPTKIYHRAHPERATSLNDLPPIVTSSPRRETKPSLTSEPATSLPPLSEGQNSPDPSRQSSPSRAPLSVLTGGKHPKEVAEKSGKIASWFKGESEPISIGIIPSPTKEKPDPFDAMPTAPGNKPPSLLQRMSTTQLIPKPAVSGRLSFLSNKISSPRLAQQPLDEDDIFFNMDINKSLFPAEPADPFSPASFKNLQQQAEGLLNRLQSAYKERSIALRELGVEKDTLAEEAQGAETRARHLKMQLDDMSVKLAEQDEAMMNLVDELAQEKQARREEQEARKRTIRVVEHPLPPKPHTGRLTRSNTVSDSGFESEDESYTESIFSANPLGGAASPTMSMSSVSTTNSPEGYHFPDLQLNPTPTSSSARLRIPTGQSASTRIPSRNQRTDQPEALRRTSCPNCEGVRASEAWSVVSILKEENKGLKDRVGELEGALDACLDVVGGVN